MRAYRTLKALEAREYVETTIGRPVKFIAIPMEDALKRMVADESKKIEKLGRLAEEIKLEWSKISKSIETPKIEPKFRIIQGRKQVYDHIAQFCERAREGIFIITTQNDLFRLSYANVEDMIGKLSRNNIKTRVLTQIQDLEIDIKDFLDFAEVRHIELPCTMRFVIVDEHEAISTFAMDDTMSMTTKNDIGLWIDAPDYVKAISTSFEALWKNSILAQDVIIELSRDKKLKNEMRLVLQDFEDAGWKAEIPGMMVGKSGVEQVFSLVAKKSGKPDNVIVIDQIKSKDESLKQLVLLSVKAMEIESSVYMLMSSEPFDKAVQRMAELYDLKLVLLKDISKFISNFMRDK